MAGCVDNRRNPNHAMKTWTQMQAFKVKRLKNGKIELTGEITGPEAYAMALRLARHWATDSSSRVQILASSNGTDFVLFQTLVSQ